MIDARVLRWTVGLIGVLGATSLVFAADVNLSGSAYIDYWGLGNGRARQATLDGVTPEVAVKVEVDVHETLGFSGKACFGCHGLEIERAYLEFTPSTKLSVQAGRLPIPFGEFSTRADPANHRTSSKPLIYEMGRMAHYGRTAFNLGVVPAPYVDTGVLAYGQAWPSQNVQIWYGGYVVAGMKGQNDIDFASMHTPFYLDNNRVPSGGARAVLTHSAATTDGWLRDFSVGVSAMHGRYDVAVARSYTALGIDASTRVKKVTLRGEVAAMRTGIDPRVPGYRIAVIDPYIEKSGFYFEVEHPIGSRLQVVYRLDALRRAGVPLPGAVSELSVDSKILRYTQGFQIPIWNAFFAKVSYEYWNLTDFPDIHAGHVGLGGTF